MISIIIPVYNVENYLDKCLESIVNQTFRDIEIILVDDGSTDSSRDKCFEWMEKDERIIYIRKKNEGQGTARNLGVSISKGEYITFVDSDDWIEKDAIEVMYNAEKESGADIVLCDINYVLKDVDGNLKSTISKLRIEENKILIPDENIKLIDVARAYTWGKLYRRDFYLNSRIEQPSYAYEDCAVVPYLIAKAKTIYYVSKPLYNYFRSRMESTVNNTERSKDLYKALIYLKDRFKEEELFDKYYEALKKVSYAQVRFVYRKFLKDRKEIDDKYVPIISDLCDLMDEFYPDWVNIDKYTIGVSGKRNLVMSVINTVFNDDRIEQDSGSFSNLIDKDILIIDLVDDLFYKDIEAWKVELIDKLKFLESNFNGKKIIAIKFIDKDEKRKDIDEIYDQYLESSLNIEVIEFCGDRLKYNENLTWDLSDKLLKTLECL